MNLKFINPVKYRLILSGQSIKKREININNEYIEVNSFQSPVTESLTFKIYIIKHEGEIVYIGITSQSIGKRISQGFRAKGENGYYGYQWKDIIGNVEILIWCSNFEYIKRFDNKYKEQSKIIEGIEGEIVYQFRKENKKWPECQNEIHFHNVDKKYKDIAKMIYTNSK